jgi:hypothetical protein
MSAVALPHDALTENNPKSPWAWRKQIASAGGNTNEGRDSKHVTDCQGLLVFGRLTFAAKDLHTTL